MIRLALMTRPGPVPSLGPTEPRTGTQSASIWCAAGRIRIGRAHDEEPPPLVGMVGLVLWLNRIVLCSMSPL